MTSASEFSGATRKLGGIDSWSTASIMSLEREKSCLNSS
jgi:hypothetical protein